ncbi:MAG: hypothetical protein ACREQ4_03550 [Candidatus Binataceae bacterium]
MVVNFLTNFIGGTIAAVQPIYDVVAPQIDNVVDVVIGAFNTFGGPIASKVQAAIAPIAAAAFTLSVDGLTGAGESTPANSIDQASKAFADAMAFGLGSFATATAFEGIFPEKLNTLDSLAPLLGQMAGFAEVAGAVRTPLYDAAFGKSLKYHFQSLFKPDLPDEADAVEWHARGLLTDDQLKVIFGYSGLKTEYEDAFIESAYRSISPFMVLRAMETGALSGPDAETVLGFYGARPSDIKLMEKAYAQLALQPYEAKVLTALEAAYERGMVSDADFSAELGKLALPAGADTYVQQAAAYVKLEQLGALYRKSVSEAYLSGQITDAEYLTNMAAVGIANPDAEAHYAVDSIKLRGKEATAAAREAAKEAATLKRASVQAANAQYNTGQTTEAEYTAALALAGVTPDIVPFALQVANARLSGKKVQVYGRLVTRGEATLLRETVAAIKESVAKKETAPEAAYNALLAQSIPTINAQALVETWAAEAKEAWTPPPL